MSARQNHVARLHVSVGQRRVDRFDLYIRERIPDCIHEETDTFLALRLSRNTPNQLSQWIGGGGTPSSLPMFWVPTGSPGPPLVFLVISQVTNHSTMPMAISPPATWY